MVVPDDGSASITTGSMSCVITLFMRDTASGEFLRPPPRGATAEGGESRRVEPMLRLLVRWESPLVTTRAAQPTNRPRRAAHMARSCPQSATQLPTGRRKTGRNSGTASDTKATLAPPS
jgi:hypothetical protein